MSPGIESEKRDLGPQSRQEDRRRATKVKSLQKKRKIFFLLFFFNSFILTKVSEELSLQMAAFGMKSFALILILTLASNGKTLIFQIKS